MQPFNLKHGPFGNTGFRVVSAICALEFGRRAKEGSREMVAGAFRGNRQIGERGCRPPLTFAGRESSRAGQSLTITDAVVPNELDGDRPQWFNADVVDPLPACVVVDGLAHGRRRSGDG